MASLITDGGQPSSRTKKLYALFDWFDRFEHSADVGAWRAADIHLWPIVKFLAVAALLRHASEAGAFGSMLRGHGRELARHIERLIHRGGHDTAAAAAALAPRAPNKILFVGNTTTFKDCGGLKVQLNYDYLRIQLEGRGFATDSLLAGMGGDLLGSSSLLPHRPLNVTELYRKIGSTAVRWSRRYPEMRELAAFLGDLLGQSRPYWLLAYFDRQICQVVDVAAAWELAFRSARPAACHVYNYTNPLGWGLAVACRRLEIPCYEIQHGLQGRMHGAYHWAVSPVGGWTSVPRGRLVWSAAEAGFMDADARPYVVGPGSLQTMAMIMKAAGPTKATVLAAMRDRLLEAAAPLWQALGREERPRVLFLSQHAGDVDLLKQLARVPELALYFRFHPSQAGKKRPAADQAILDQALAESCSTLPLPVVMAGVDANLVHSSAAFLEGRYFGLSTVFMDDYARTIAESYGDRDVVLSSVKEAVKDVRALDLRPRASAPLDRLSAMFETLPDMGKLADMFVARPTEQG